MGPSRWIQVQMRHWAFIKPLLAVFFILLPLVPYLASYNPDDCDDKAVHFYSAMYFLAPAKDQGAFQAMTRPFVRAYENDPRWERTAFRLRSVNTYPLANVAISLFHHRDKHYTEGVKWGLLAVTLISVLAVVLIGSTTPFGFWQTVLVLNLIAFHLIPADLPIGPVPNLMHPFISYVPRGAAAAMVIAAVLAFAAKRPSLFIISLLLVFLWHAGLALVNAGLALTAAALFWVVTRYQLLHTPFLYLLFGLGLLGGLGTLLRTGIIGCLLYLYSRHIKGIEVDFHHRAFLFGLLFLFMAIIGSAIAAIPQVGQLLQSATGLAVARELPQRLIGSTYSLLVLSTVVGGRLLYSYATSSFPQLRSQPKRAQLGVAVIVILLIIGLTHRAVNAKVWQRKLGFFQATCQEARILALPENLSHLSLDDEPTLFLSLGHYLFRQNDRWQKKEGADFPNSFLVMVGKGSD